MKISGKRIPSLKVVTFLGCLLAGTTCGAVPNTWSGTVSTNWFEGGNWSLSTAPAPGETVSVPKGTPFAPTLTNATEALASFHLAAGQTLTVIGWDSVVEAETINILGTVTHAANNVTVTNSLGGWTPLHRVWLKGSNITVAADGVINADYLGYPPGAGPGAGVGTGGAGHAGEGRRGRGGSSVAPAYGDPAAPWQPGSGGGEYSRSRPGGGSIRVEASGRLELVGQLRARGQNADGGAAHGRGSAGGSIWLTCHTISGTSKALVTVDGGNGHYYGAPGSAGRIALHYDTVAQATLFEPRPPIRFSGKAGVRTSALQAEVLPAAMGTLYLPDSLLVTSTLTGKRFQYTRLVIPGFTHWSPAALTLDDCIIGLPEGITLDVTTDLVLTNGAGLHLFATPVTDVLNDAGATISVGGNLVLSGNSWLFPYADNTNGATVMIEVTGDVTVSANSGINADYLGYTFCEGPGSLPVAGGYGRGGGSYGGQGGQGYDGVWGGTPYGAPEGPAQAGSGGCATALLAGQGGGAIRLEVGGSAEIDGTLTAAGAEGIADHGSGGSGGGIELTCRTLTGNGLLSAEGGKGNHYSGSGSGGRIAVHYDLAAQAALPQQPAIRFSTYTFPDTTVFSFNYKAEMGSLYLPDTSLLAASPSAAAVLNNQRFWHTRLVIPEWTSWSPAALTISNCVIAFSEGFHLSIPGDLMLGDNAGLNLFAAPTNACYGARLDVGGNLLIGSGGWLYPHAHYAAGSIVGLFIGGAVWVEDGGGINADGKGWFSVSGNTQGLGAGKGGGSGGGYGGIGGRTSGGSVYGLAALPLEPGSPGVYAFRGGTSGSSVSGKGGGAIHLVAGGSARVDGILSANGNAGHLYGGGGGSGGAIFLALGGRLSGDGALQARASGSIYTQNEYKALSSGGGGRIAVWTHTQPEEVAWRIAETNFSGLTRRATASSFTGQLDVSAAVSTTNPQAGDGTVGFYSHTGTVFVIR